MSEVVLNEQPINTSPNLLEKDGSDLRNVKQADIGTPGGAFISMKDGRIEQYDSSGNLIILFDPNG